MLGKDALGMAMKKQCLVKVIAHDEREENDEAEESVQFESRPEIGEDHAQFFRIAPLKAQEEHGGSQKEHGDGDEDIGGQRQGGLESQDDLDGGEGGEGEADGFLERLPSRPRGFNHRRNRVVGGSGQRVRRRFTIHRKYAAFRR